MGYPQSVLLFDFVAISGMCVINVRKAFTYSLCSRNTEKIIGVRVLVSLLVGEMLHNTDSNLSLDDVSRSLPLGGGGDYKEVTRKMVCWGQGHT